MEKEREGYLGRDVELRFEEFELDIFGAELQAIVVEPDLAEGYDWGG